MGRLRNHLNTVLNVVFIAAAFALAVLGVLSLFGGPTLRFFPYMAGVCGLYYLALSVKTFMQEERRSGLKGGLLLALALFCSLFSYITFRSLI